MAVYIAAALMGAVGLLWLVAKALNWDSAHIIGIAFAGVAAICVGYLAIEKFVGVGYTRGFYMSMALVAIVGALSGLALRRAR